MSAITPLARILAKAQGVIDAETGLPIDVGGEVVAIRDELRNQRAEIERLREAARTFITAMDDCSDYPDTTSDMEGLVYAKRKVEAALAKKEDK